MNALTPLFVSNPGLISRQGKPAQTGPERDGAK